MAAPLQNYQFKPFLGSSHIWAIESALKLPTQVKVLDVGCAGGLIGAKLKESNFTNLNAVEIDAAAREKARPIYKEIAADLTHFEGQKFDLILLLDVLEHIADPASFMKQIENLMASGGTLLLSVPNFAHWSVRIPLLFGFLPESERGILDKTHLQQYTRQRLINFIQKNTELSIQSFDSSIEPAEFLLPHLVTENFLFRFLSKIRIEVARALPGMFAYQHLAILKKK